MRALLFAIAALALTGGQAAADNPIQHENSFGGLAGWTPMGPSTITGYASESSVVAGDTLHLHVSAPPRADYRIEFYRLGWYGGQGGRLLACIPSCFAYRPGATFTAPSPDPATGEIRPSWPVTDSLPIPADWFSGYYLARLLATDGSPRGSVPFVVREADLRHSAALVVAPVNTWLAYNGWGGKSLYNSSSSSGVPANHVSFDRPYLWGAPGAQPVSSWELPLIHFLEREGVDVSYATDADVDRDPDLLLRHRLVIVGGHDEYWTKAMRDAYERARDSGTNLAFMGANAAYWQVRYESGGRTMVGYKSAADPELDPGLKSVLFRELAPPRPECALLGVQHQGGSLAWPRGDYLVTAPDHPWFAGTGLSGGAAIAGIVSREHDQVPDGTSCGHALTVLFEHRGATPLERADAVTYTADSGARVFASGSLEFAWGLDEYRVNGDGYSTPVDPRLQQFVRNMLGDLERPEPPTAVFVRSWKRASIKIAVRWPADPRILGAFVSREGPTGPISICKTPVRACFDRPGPGTYRYDAQLVDQWGRSVPWVSAPISTGRRRRRCCAVHGHSSHSNWALMQP